MPLDQHEPPYSVLIRRVNVSANILSLFARPSQNGAPIYIVRFMYGYEVLIVFEFLMPARLNVENSESKASALGWPTVRSPPGPAGILKRRVGLARGNCGRNICNPTNCLYGRFERLTVIEISFDGPSEIAECQEQPRVRIVPVAVF